MIQQHTWRVHFVDRLCVDVVAPSRSAALAAARAATESSAAIVSVVEIA